jgi:hypothetical protein
MEELYNDGRHSVAADTATFYIACPVGFTSAVQNGLEYAHSAPPASCVLAHSDACDAVTKTGGHLGWVSDVGGYFGEPWTDSIIIEWLLSVQVQLSRNAANVYEGRNGSRLPHPHNTQPFSRPLHMSIRSSMHNAEHSLQPTQALAIASECASGSVDVPCCSNAGEGGKGSIPRLAKSGEIYDRVTGLPVQEHDGMRLSPSQTGYFGLRVDKESLKRDAADEIREDVKNGTSTTLSAAGDINSLGSSLLKRPSVNSSVNNREPLGRLFGSEIEQIDGSVDTSLALQQQQNVVGVALKRARKSQSHSSSNGSEKISIHEGFKTPDLQPSNGALGESQGADEGTSPFNGSEDLTQESSYLIPGSSTGDSTAHHVEQRQSVACRDAVESIGASQASVHPPSLYQMTADGLKEVRAEESFVTPPRLAKPALDRNSVSSGVVPVQFPEGGEASDVDWVDASPQRLAGAAAALTMLYEAASSKCMRDDTYRSSEWGKASEASSGRVGEVLRCERHMLAAVGQGVAQEIKRQSMNSGTQEECASEATGSLGATVPSPSKAAVEGCGPEGTSEVQKHLRVLSAISLSYGAHSVSVDGPASAAAGQREQVAATVGTATVATAATAISRRQPHTRTMQQHVHQDGEDSRRVGGSGDIQRVRKPVWWKR